MNLKRLGCRYAGLRSASRVLRFHYFFQRRKITVLPAGNAALRRATGPLADLRAVERHEGLDVVICADVHESTDYVYLN